MSERQDADIIHHPGAPRRIDHTGLDATGRVRKSLGLDLDENRRPPLGQIEELVEPRHDLTREHIAEARRVAGVEEADSIPLQFANHAATVGRPVDRRVVHQDRHAVCGQLDVTLENLGPGVQGALERKQRVLRDDRREAAVGDQERPPVPARHHATPSPAPPSTAMIVPVM